MVCEHPHPTQSLQRPRNRRVAVAAATTVLAVMTGAAIKACRRVVVSGESMRPAFEPGDRVLVVPVLRLHPGQVVAVPDPRQPDRLLLKRVLTAGPGLVDVRGDNQGASTDSRDFGLIPRTSVIGRAVYRYAPPDRAGRLSG